MNANRDAGLCPNCQTGTMDIFHVARNVPTNSCILLESRAEAMSYPKGDITLGFCSECGFVGNTSFDAKLTEYSGRSTPSTKPDVSGVLRRSQSDARSSCTPRSADAEIATGRPASTSAQLSSAAE